MGTQMKRGTSAGTSLIFALSVLLSLLIEIAGPDMNLSYKLGYAAKVVLRLALEPADTYLGTKVSVFTE